MAIRLGAAESCCRRGSGAGFVTLGSLSVIENYRFACVGTAWEEIGVLGRSAAEYVEEAIVVAG